MKSILLFLTAIFGALFLQAAEPKQGHALTTPEEQEIRQKAKKRLYPGGQDEESLKVQAQLLPVTRKMSPATENQSDEGEPSGEE